MDLMRVNTKFFHAFWYEKVISCRQETMTWMEASQELEIVPIVSISGSTEAALGSAVISGESTGSLLTSEIGVLLTTLKGLMQRHKKTIKITEKHSK